MSTTDTALPEVGAKIRVTLHHRNGDVVGVDGPLVDVRHESGGVAWLRLPGGLEFAVKDGDNSVTVEVLEAAPKPLPAEPALGGYVLVGEWPRAGIFQRAVQDRDGFDYLEPFSRAYLKWETVCAQSEGTPVPLVAAPDLAELVEALFKVAYDWMALHESDHRRACGPASFDTCPNVMCVDRRDRHGPVGALLARHAGAEASRD